MPHKHEQLYTLIAGLLAGLLFAFPCPAQTHIRSRSVTDAALKEVLKQYLTDRDVENARSARYIASFVDLNDDGKKEVIVHVISHSLCGTGGCPTLVLAPQQSSFNIVSRISITRPPIRVLNTKSHGWHDLAVWVAGGGIQPGYEADLPFDGNSYAPNPTVAPAHRLRSRSAGRLKVREGLRTRWYTGNAHLLPEDDPRERQRWLARERPGSAANASVVRLMGTQLLTVRVELDD